MSNQLTNKNDTTPEQTARLLTIDYLSANEFTFKKPTINKNNKKKTKTHHFNLNDQSTTVNSPKSTKSILNQTTIQHESRHNTSIDTELIYKLLNYPMSPSVKSYKSFSPKTCLTEGGYYPKQVKKGCYKKENHTRTLAVNKSAIINNKLSNIKIAKPVFIKTHTLNSCNSLMTSNNSQIKINTVTIMKGNDKKRANHNHFAFKAEINHLNTVSQKYEKTKKEHEIKLKVIEMMIKENKEIKGNKAKSKNKCLVSQNMNTTKDKYHTNISNNTINKTKQRHFKLNDERLIKCKTIIV